MCHSLHSKYNEPTRSLFRVGNFRLDRDTYRPFPRAATTSWVSQHDRNKTISRFDTSWFALLLLLLVLVLLLFSFLSPSAGIPRRNHSSARPNSAIHKSKVIQFLGCFLPPSIDCCPTHLASPEAVLTLEASSSRTSARMHHFTTSQCTTSPGSPPTSQANLRATSTFVRCRRDK